MKKIFLQKKSQVSIELILGFVIIFLFLLGIVQIFDWFNTQQATRMMNYSQIRYLAGQQTKWDAPDWVMDPVNFLFQTDSDSITLPYTPLALAEMVMFDKVYGATLYPKVWSKWWYPGATIVGNGQEW